MTDWVGRTGTAETIDEGVGDQGSSFSYRLIVDRSGRALASVEVAQKAGQDASHSVAGHQVQSAYVVRSSGWTDEKPPMKHCHRRKKLGRRIWGVPAELSGARF